MYVSIGAGVDREIGVVEEAGMGVIVGVGENSTEATVFAMNASTVGLKAAVFAMDASPATELGIACSANMASALAL
jgi:hypothetical protein